MSSILGTKEGMIKNGHERNDSMINLIFLND